MGRMRAAGLIFHELRITNHESGFSITNHDSGCSITHYESRITSPSFPGSSWATNSASPFKLTGLLR